MEPCKVNARQWIADVVAPDVDVVDIIVISSHRTRHFNCHGKQQSWSEVGAVAVHRCATLLLVTR